MADQEYVLLTKLVKEFDLSVIYAATDYEKIRITVADVARPGLQLAGYFEHFAPMRLQIMGNVEYSYMRKMTAAERRLVFDRFFSYKFPALILAREMEPSEECLYMARRHNVTLLSAKESTSNILSSLIAYLKIELSPKIARHGVLMEVYGEGILITGDSGIGKSETAIELIKRGHRLIADDAVEIKRLGPNTISGTAPPLIKDYIELRGIGIINVAKLFGIGAVKQENVIDLVVNIVPWDNHANYDRLGLEESYEEILGVKVPLNTIPVTPGRNLAVILEVAAMNNRQRKLGYNAAVEFTEQINRHFLEVSKQNN